MIIVLKVVTEVNQNPKVRKVEIEVVNHARVQNRNRIQKMNQKQKMIKKMRKIRMKILNKIMRQNQTRTKRTNPSDWNAAGSNVAASATNRPRIGR